MPAAKPAHAVRPERQATKSKDILAAAQDFAPDWTAKNQDTGKYCQPAVQMYSADSSHLTRSAPALQADLKPPRAVCSFVELHQPAV